MCVGYELGHSAESAESAPELCASSFAVRLPPGPLPAI